MRTTPAPLAEKMVLFWHGHFTSSAAKTDIANMWDQLQIFRSIGLGRFAALANATAISPAMLSYLDNASNVAAGANENFARELLELFTLGPGNYAQSDVVSAAKAWTGHGLSQDRRTYVFTTAKHDNANKTFLGTTRNWDGPDLIDSLCTGVTKNIVARHVALRMWRFFADQQPPAATIDVLATAFAASDLNVSALLKALFTHPDFYSVRARTQHVRTPVEWLVAAMHHTNQPASVAHPEWYLEAMGQRPLYPPNVGGWPGGSAWVSTTATWARANAARTLTWPARHAGMLADTRSASVATAAQRALDAFGIDQPSASTRMALQSVATAERAVKGWAEQPNLITLGLLSPEFQVG